MLPGHLIGAGAPEDEARVELVRRAAAALGVATLDDLADYFRLRPAETRPAVAELQAAGELLPVVVEGWNSRGGAPVAAWLHRDAAVPSRVHRDALLTPFDPVVWYRPRAERIHGFCRDELRGWLEQAGYHDICFYNAGVVGKEVDGERQDFPMFLAVAKV